MALKMLIMYGVLQCLVKITCAVAVARINTSIIFGSTVRYNGRNVDQYLGIRYAQAPVGPLRFKKPEPVRGYPLVTRATTNPPACLQYTTRPFPWYINSTEKSEDCLFLNIWAPSSASKRNKKAVMYWMYGGGFRYGSIRDDIYDGRRLAAEGDIIVVTVNYRLGYFGFLFSNSTDAPGNYGIWDVLEGLRWLNKYIGEFGGDVSRITIAGQSAGSVDVAFMSISPLAKGLFARQIMESTSPVYRVSDNNTQNLAFSQQVAKYLGCANDSYTISAHPKEVVTCLRGVDAERLSRADFELSPSGGYHLYPQWGDELLPVNPRLSIINGDFKCSDLLIGSNKDEGSYVLTAILYRDYFGFYGEKNTHVNRSTGESMIRQIVRLFPEQDSIVNHYLPPNLTEDVNYEIRRQVYTAAGDTIYLCPNTYYAEKCAEQNRKVYFYYFTHRPTPSVWAEWLGVTHFDEVQFVFGKPRPGRDPNYDQSEFQLSRQVIAVWSSFVKVGKPPIDWPLYSRAYRTYKEIGPTYITKEGSFGTGPHAENCDFLRPLFGF